jgi:hypothetical protein
MSIETRNVQYSKELDDLASMAILLVTEVKAGKDLPSIVSDVLPGLVKAIGEFSTASSDLENNKQVAYETLGYRLGDLVNALLA